MREFSHLLTDTDGITRYFCLTSYAFCPRQQGMSAGLQSHTVQYRGLSLTPSPPSLTN